MGSWLHGTRHRPDAYPTVLQPQTTDTFPTPAQFTLASLAPYQQRIMGSITMNRDKIDNEKRRGQCNGQNSLIAAADGGVRNPLAAHAYTIRFANEDILIEGAAPTDGESVTSYRAELFGLYAVLLGIKILETELGNIEIGVDVFCDNQSATNIVRGLFEERDLQPMASDYDILREIQALSGQIFSKVTLIWIKGHQSDDGRGTADPRGI